MQSLGKKIVLDERGNPLEVIIPWQQFCEISQSLGLDFVKSGSSDRTPPESSPAFRKQVESHLLQAIDSGPARTLDRKGWDQIRSAGIKFTTQRKGVRKSNERLSHTAPRRARSQ
jgi:hypothetical protein